MKYLFFAVVSLLLSKDSNCQSKISEGGFGHFMTGVAYADQDLLFGYLSDPNT